LGETTDAAAETSRPLAAAAPLPRTETPSPPVFYRVLNEVPAVLIIVIVIMIIVRPGYNG
jgi:uncharacterized membrane protein